MISLFVWALTYQSKSQYKTDVNNTEYQLHMLTKTIKGVIKFYSSFCTIKLL